MREGNVLGLAPNIVPNELTIALKKDGDYFPPRCSPVAQWD